MDTCGEKNHIIIKSNIIGHVNGGGVHMVGVHKKGHVQDSSLCFEWAHPFQVFS